MVPTEIADADVVAFVRGQLGTRLLTVSQGQAAPPPAETDFTWAVEATMFEPPPVTDNQRAQAAFERLLKRPQAQTLKAGRDDCAIAAEVTDLKVKSRSAKRGGEVEFQIEGRQKQSVDLYRIASSKDLEKGIEWDRTRVSNAISAATDFPPARRLELARLYEAALNTRNQVMECVHRAGTEWPIQGTIRARWNGAKWDYEVKRLRAEKRPSSKEVTKDQSPAGLLLVDPENYAASATEWSRPYEALFAATDRIAGEVKLAEEQQTARLKEFLQPGKAWDAAAKGAGFTLGVKLEITEIRDGKFYVGTCTLRRDAVEMKIPVFGFDAVLRDYELPDDHARLPSEMFGPIVVMKPQDPGSLKEPFDQLELRIATRPKDEAPAFVLLKMGLPAVAVP